MVLGQILQLDDAACPAAGPVRAVKREHPSGAAIGADRLLHGAVLADGRLGELLAAGQHIRHILVGVGQHFLYGLLVQGLRLDALLGEPVLHLRDAVGVLQPGAVAHTPPEVLLRLGVNVDGSLHQRHVHEDAPVVDFLVEVVLIPNEVRYGELRQPRLDAKLHLNVPGVVFLEQRPFLRVVPREVPGAPAVLLGGTAGLTEVFDEVGAFFHFLLVQLQHRAHTLEGQRQTHVRAPDA